MSPAVRSVLRGLVIAAGVAVALGGVLTFRLEDWPIYVTYVLLSAILFWPHVEVLPNLILPVPALALTMGFLYIAGLPIVLLHAVVPLLAQLARVVPFERWRAHVPQIAGAGTGWVSSVWARDASGRALAAADWAALAVGLGVRWWIVTMLVPEGRPALHPGAMLVAEAGGYLYWTLQSMLPIFSFRPVLPTPAKGRVYEVHIDLGLIMGMALEPFVFLIAYGYAAHGLAGAAGWSLSTLVLHFMLKRLKERTITVEEQNQRLEALKRELEHRERLSAIGKMSSVVSHQMLQQLGLIGIHADLIRNAEAGGDLAAAVAEARANAGAIEDALGGVNRVLTDLLVFSRDLRLNLYEHQLRRLLAECLEECHAQATERGIRLRLDSPADSTVTLDKLKVKQAVVNVLRNAIEASPVGEEVVVYAGVTDGWAEVSIADRGPGIPPGDQVSVFTPFFTTKEQGTGLGLAIAREFTEAHGGRIVVADGGGPGATFVLRLPLRGPSAPE